MRSRKTVALISLSASGRKQLVLDDCFQPKVCKNVMSAGETRQKQALPFKVRVTWKHALATAMLAHRDLARMAEFEGLMLSAVTESGSAKWVCTVTGVHQREWIFYARNDDAFITRVQATLAPTGALPVTANKPVQ